MNEMRRQRSEFNRAAILASARREIESKGILGLRVVEVAAGANTPVTKIYRFFGDREGLLVQVLGDMYEEFHHRVFELVLEALPAEGPLTVEILAGALPSPTDAFAHHMHEHRMQIMAASVTNADLEERLTRITENAISRWEELTEMFRMRMAPDEAFDPEFIVMYFGLQNPYLWEVMGSKAFTEVEYRAFLARHLRV